MRPLADRSTRPGDSRTCGTNNFRRQPGQITWVSAHFDSSWAAHCSQTCNSWVETPSGLRRRATMMTVLARTPWQRLQWVGSLGIDMIMYPTCCWVTRCFFRDAARATLTAFAVDRVRVTAEAGQSSSLPTSGAPTAMAGVKGEAFRGDGDRVSDEFLPE